MKMMMMVMMKSSHTIIKFRSFWFAADLTLNIELLLVICVIFCIIIASAQRLQHQHQLGVTQVGDHWYYTHSPINTLLDILQPKQTPLKGITKHHQQFNVCRLAQYLTARSCNNCLQSQRDLNKIDKHKNLKKIPLFEFHFRLFIHWSSIYDQPTE